MTYNVFGETLNLTLSIYAAPHASIICGHSAFRGAMLPAHPKNTCLGRGGVESRSQFRTFVWLIFSCQAYTTEPLIYFGHLGDESAGWPENSAVKHRRAT